MAKDETKPQSDAPKAKRKHTGAAKRSAQRRVGKPVSLQPIDLSTPAKSAAAQALNGRSAVAGGRTERVDAETNIDAFPLIKNLCVTWHVALDARGLSAVVVQGAELICEQLSVIVEVAAMSASAIPSGEVLDDAAFVAKRRDAIQRLAPRPADAPFRAKFGLHELVRPGKPGTLKLAASRLLSGKKANPKSRAAKLITADDEKRLRAIVKSISTTTAEQKKARAASVSRTTERDILNAALELFYDDFAASIGLVLESDEVARLQALELIPRRPERRTEADEKGGAGGGATAPAGASSATGTSAPASPATSTA